MMRMVTFTRAAPLRATSGLCVALALTTFSPTADAAVRQCMQPISSEIVPAQSELLGKQMALRSWRDKARKRHGDEFSNWRTANRKVIGCRPAKDGSAPFQCLAFAFPCKIEQVPGAVPAPKKRQRTPPGTPIET